MAADACLSSERVEINLPATPPQVVRICCDTGGVIPPRLPQSVASREI